VSTGRVCKSHHGFVLRSNLSRISVEAAAAAEAGRKAEEEANEAQKRAEQEAAEAKKKAGEWH